MVRRVYSAEPDLPGDIPEAATPEGYAACYRETHGALDSLEETVQELTAYWRDYDADLAVLVRRREESAELLDDIAAIAGGLGQRWRDYRRFLDRCREREGFGWVDDVDDLNRETVAAVKGYEDGIRRFHRGDMAELMDAFPAAEPYVRAWGQKQRDVGGAAALDAVLPDSHPFHIKLDVIGDGAAPAPCGSPVTYTGLYEKLADAEDVTYRIRHPGTGEETRIDAELAAEALDTMREHGNATFPGMTYDGYTRRVEIGFGWKNGVLWETMEPEPARFADGATLLMEWTSDYRGGVEDVPLLLQAATGRMSLPGPEQVAEQLGVDPATPSGEHDSSTDKLHI